MIYLRWTIRILLVALVLATLHYNLPRHEVVRIVGVETQRMDFGLNRFFYSEAAGGTADAPTRDVRLIETMTPEGRERVFRNQDTGWGWPPYFKFGSANLQARARDLISSSNDPQYLVVTYYGWRNEIISIFPNVVQLRIAEGPEERVFPWATISALVILGVLAMFVWRVWVRIRDRWFAPRAERMAEASAPARARLRDAWRKLTGRGGE